MIKNLLVFVLVAGSLMLKAQTLRLSGNTKDTVSDGVLPNTIMMALKFTDSTLAGYSRSDAQGVFKSFKVPLDTYLVIISHPNFSDRTFLLVPSEKDTAFTFKNVVLPPKSVVLNEVEIIANRDKSYYKGDTLIFTADSFKTKDNATVEDLLKKLPGVRVDVNGKITVQGKEVDQVLVDGDEFFGTDPTVATRNLNATSVQNVQVFEKKNENTEEGANETLKVINLQLKDDAKKGYFGKVSGASDFQRFYENELLANKFKGNKKISVFGLLANTPKQAFGYGDADKYGLSGEQQNWTFNDETGSWSNNRDDKKGVPQTIKTGFYYNDKISKNTKVNTDYTYNRNQLFTGTETNTQFFLDDTTYSNARVSGNSSLFQNHGFNFKIIHKLDSLTELTFFPKIRYSTSGTENRQRDDFISEDGQYTRSTELINKTNSETRDVNTLIKINRNFMKKGRSVALTYQPIYNNYVATTNLDTRFDYATDQLPDSSLSQKRQQDNTRMEHNAFMLYTEPITKKFKTEINYNFTQNQNSTNRQTFDLVSAGNDIFNPILSNSFDNLRLINRTGAKLIYEVKKYRISAGTQYRNVWQENFNITTGRKLYLNVNNILPNASFNYRINQGSNLSFFYNTSSQQPELLQMQPVVDNSDPNRISIGNPDLKPTFTHNGNFHYYIYKGITDLNFWSGGNVSNTSNQISNRTFYDSLGRAITQPLNVDGNYYASAYIGGGFPVFKHFLKIYLSYNTSLSNNISFVNDFQTVSKNTSHSTSFTIAKDVENFEMQVEANYHYNLPRTNLSVQSQQPYYTYSIEGNVLVKLPKKVSLGMEGNYVNNGNRTPGYNLNYFILNGSLNKSFFKNEDLVVSIQANDILNQNISNERYINSNTIVDKKTQIIRRYILLKLLYKFNSQKTRMEEEDYD